MPSPKQTNRLYALLDRDTLDRRGWSLERFVAQADALGAEMIQYRDKSGDRARVQEALETIRHLYKGRLIVNDYPEVVRFCDGIHVGQEDLARYGETKAEALAALREWIGEDKIVGLSTHNVEEIEEANNLALDYIGLGAYRTTTTKSDANLLGEEVLPRLAALSAHPVAAIGGVRLDDRIPHVTWLVVGSGLYED